MCSRTARAIRGSPSASRRNSSTDQRIVVEFGDFSSAASMAASPIYQAAGLVQFGFTNSHPDFTKGGDYIWSNAVNQKDEHAAAGRSCVATGIQALAVLLLNSDWGRTAKDLFGRRRSEARGGEVVVAEGYLADEKDFRSRSCACAMPIPDGIALISYYPDGAQITPARCATRA